MAAGFGTMNHQNSNIIIGEEQGWGDPQPFGVAAVDERQHLYIIGKTGTGKTTLLRNLILQHIALGHGVGVIAGCPSSVSSGCISSVSRTWNRNI